MDGSAHDGRRLWVVTPVFFDVESFLILRRRILEVVHDGLEHLSVTFVVVDDSAGRDADILELGQFADVHVEELPFNVGHQRALVHGVRRLRGRIDDDDFVVTLDADGEDRPEDLPRLLGPLLDERLEARTVCLARRTKRQETLAFKAWYLAFRLLFRALTGTVVRSGNFAAFRGIFVRTTLAHPSFDLCFSSTLVSLDIPTRFVACERGQRYAGRSRMNRARLFAHGVRMLMPFLDRIAVRALFLFGGVFALSIVSAVGVLGVRLFTDLAIPGWATFTLIGAVLVSLTSLGSFIVLFATYSQSRAVSLVSLDGSPNSTGVGSAFPADRDETIAT